MSDSNMVVLNTQTLYRKDCINNGCGWKKDNPLFPRDLVVTKKQKVGDRTTTGPQACFPGLAGEQEVKTQLHLLPCTVKLIR